ncbi:Pol I core factor CF, partial [Gonapodya sp. JEL0774]
EEMLPSGSQRLRRPTGVKRRMGQKLTYKAFMSTGQIAFHQLEALQLILKAQLKTIVRDLWLLYINVSPQATGISSNEARGMQSEEHESLEFEEDGSEDGMEGEQDDLDDPILKESDDEVDDEIGDGRKNKMWGAEEKPEMSPELAEREEKANLKTHRLLNRLHLALTVSMCYLGCLWLRLPVMIKDLQRWIASGRLPYVNAIDTVLPSGLRDLLWGSAHIFLRPRAIPSVEELYLRSSAVRLRLNTAHGIEFPPLNYPIITFRIMEDLLLPPEFYLPLRGLLDVLGYNGSFHVTIVDRRSYPEVTLLAAFAILLKMVYGLDDQGRHVQNNSLSERMGPFHTWVWALTEGRESKLDAAGVPPDETDLESFVDRNLSEYLRFLADNVMATEVNAGILNSKNIGQCYLLFTPTLFAMPLPDIAPGSNYQIYPGHLALRFLPSSYLFVLDRCAGIAGVEPELLHRSMRKLEIELKLEQHWMAKLIEKPKDVAIATGLASKLMIVPTTSILDLPVDAPIEKINRAYKRSAIKYHPDKTKNATEQKLYTVLTSVVETLRDPNGRERYNFYLKRGFPMWRGTGYYYSHFKPSMTFVLLFILIVVSIAQHLAGYAKYRYDSYRLSDLRAALVQSKISLPQLKAEFRKKGNVDVETFAELKDLDLENLWFVANGVDIRSIAKSPPVVWDFLIVKFVIGAVKLLISIPEWPSRYQNWQAKRRTAAEQKLAEEADLRRQEEDAVREAAELEAERSRLKEQKEAKKRRKRVAREQEIEDAFLAKSKVTDLQPGSAGIGPRLSVGSNSESENGEPTNTSDIWEPHELSRMGELLKKFPSGKTGRYVLVARVLKRPVDQVSKLAKVLAKDSSLLKSTEPVNISEWI